MLHGWLGRNHWVDLATTSWFLACMVATLSIVLISMLGLHLQVGSMLCRALCAVLQ